MSRIRILMVAGAALAGLSFVWGYRTHRDGTFPYELFRRWKLTYGEPLNVRPPAVPSEQLVAALPYVDASFDPESRKRGVILHDRARTQPGWSFFHSATHSDARLLDLEGRVVHSWSFPTRPWEHAELLPNGDLLIVVDEQQLLRIDARSQLIWRRDLPAHHAVDVSETGEIYAIARRPRLVPEVDPVVRVVDDVVTVLDPAGATLRELSVVDLLLDSPYAMLLPSLGASRVGERLAAADAQTVDLLHTNHVQVLGTREAGSSEPFRPGQIVLSLRNVNTVLVVDPERRAIVWAWGPSNLIFPHSPAILPDGHLLVFNNGVDESEVLELDPRSLRVTWRFGPGAGFFSATRGAAQRLPNGNTLITESDRGYVHEVSPDGDVVWRYANPAVDDRGRREIIWVMKRFAPGSLPFLEKTSTDR